MTSIATATGRNDERTLVITRVFDAPRPLVYRAWTDPEHLARWSGPRGFTLTSGEMDFRVGGRYRFSMHAPDGEAYSWQGVYRDIVASERLVFSFAWEDADGRPGHETQVTLLFETLGDKTRLTLRQEIFETPESRDSHEEGWSSALDCLADHLTETQAQARASNTLDSLADHLASIRTGAHA